MQKSDGISWTFGKLSSELRERNKSAAEKKEELVNKLLANKIYLTVYCYDTLKALLASFLSVSVYAFGGFILIRYAALIISLINEIPALGYLIVIAFFLIILSILFSTIAFSQGNSVLISVRNKAKIDKISLYHPDIS